MEAALYKKLLMWPYPQFSAPTRHLLIHTASIEQVPNLSVVISHLSMHSIQLGLLRILRLLHKPFTTGLTGLLD